MAKSTDQTRIAELEARIRQLEQAGEPERLRGPGTNGLEPTIWSGSSPNVRTSIGEARQHQLDQSGVPISCPVCESGAWIRVHGHLRCAECNRWLDDNVAAEMKKVEESNAALRQQVIAAQNRARQAEEAAMRKRRRQRFDEDLAKIPLEDR